MDHEHPTVYVAQFWFDQKPPGTVREWERIEQRWHTTTCGVDGWDYRGHRGFATPDEARQFDVLAPYTRRRVVEIVPFAEPLIYVRRKRVVEES